MIWPGKLPRLLHLCYSPAIHAKAMPLSGRSWSAVVDLRASRPAVKGTTFLQPEDAS
jgi:hypothetical protein